MTADPNPNPQDRLVLIGLLALAAIVGLSLAFFAFVGQGVTE